MAARRTSFIDDFTELADSCVAFYEKNNDKMRLERVRGRRSDLAVFAESFHKDCGTLTASVQERIAVLKEGRGVILMTAHQPNFFAYSGVLRKATLNFVLAKRLEKLLGVPVVNFFGIADQDFTDDRWVRSCQLPAVQRSDGILSLDMKVPERLMLNRITKPSRNVLKQWSAEIERWLDDAISSVRRLRKALDLPEMCSPACAATLHENFASFWNLVEGSYERAEKFSDFNAFLTSKIVNDVWVYDTVFARFSECQQAFVEEFRFLLSRFKDYSRLLREATQIPREGGVEGGVSDQEPLRAPFWYHCDCGSKVKLRLIARDGALFGEGRCMNCEQNHALAFGAKNDLDISAIASRISARAIPMCLVFFDGLVPSCYVGGVGGSRYLMEAEHVAKGLKVPFPPVTVWRPHDRYLGVGQVEARLELKRICRDLGAPDLATAQEMLRSRIAEIHERLDTLEASKKSAVERLEERPNDEALKEEVKSISMSQTRIKRSSNLSVISHKLKIVENVSTALDVIPSVIDYAVNVGLKETSEQWMRFLGDGGSLSSDVHLKSVLTQNDLNTEIET